MKISNIKLIMGGALFATIMSTSCSKIERTPFNVIDKSQSFQSVKDAKSWNNGLYATLRGNVYGIFTYSTDVQADQLNATLDYGNRNGFPHRWDGFLASDYTIRDVWSGYYNAIANINVALQGFGTIAPQDANETSSLNEYKGDAHLARAYYYLQLMLRWSKAYNPSTADKDLGVPLLTKFDLNGMPSRATSKDVYTQILKDIDSAKSYLGGITGAPGATKFNKDVAVALEARVKLYMQDWTGAASAANTLINSATYPLATSAAAFTAAWAVDDPVGTIFQCFVSKPNELANTNSIYLGYNAGNDQYTPDFLPSKWVVDAYDANDYRKSAYFLQDSILIQGNTYYNIYLVNKYPGNPALFTGASTNYQQAPKVFRIAEMYLIAAEAEAKAGTGTPLATLNKLRTHRGLTAISVSGAALMDSIKAERFRELAFEGFRLDDLKRWNEGFTRHDPQNTSTINQGADYDTKTVAAGADKFTWGIPTNDITVNTNLKGEQNPGW